MKKIYLVLIVLSVMLLSSCSVSKPVYNSEKQSVAQYHKELQQYYQQVQKKGKKL